MDYGLMALEGDVDSRLRDWMKEHGARNDTETTHYGSVNDDDVVRLARITSIPDPHRDLRGLETWCHGVLALRGVPIDWHRDRQDGDGTVVWCLNGNRERAIKAVRDLLPTLCERWPTMRATALVPELKAKDLLDGVEPVGTFDYQLFGTPEVFEVRVGDADMPACRERLRRWCSLLAQRAGGVVNWSSMDGRLFVRCRIADFDRVAREAIKTFAAFVRPLAGNPELLLAQQLTTQQLWARLGVDSAVDPAVAASLRARDRSDALPLFPATALVEVSGTKLPCAGALVRCAAAVAGDDAAFGARDFLGNCTLYCAPGYEREAWQALARVLPSLGDVAPDARYRVIDTATPVPLARVLVAEADYRGWIYWANPHDDERCYFATPGDLREYCLEHEVEPPRYVNGCAERRLELDAHEFVREELERQDADEDAFDRVDDEKLGELQRFLDAWVEEEGTKWYECDDATEVRMDETAWAEVKERHDRWRREAQRPVLPSERCGVCDSPMTPCACTGDVQF